MALDKMAFSGQGQVPERDLAESCQLLTCPEAGVLWTWGGGEVGGDLDSTPQHSLQCEIGNGKKCHRGKHFVQ